MTSLPEQVVSAPDLQPDSLQSWRLHIDGLVQAAAELTVAEIEALGSMERAESFLRTRTAVEGEQRWEGTPLGAIFARVEPLERATWFYAHAEGFRALLPLAAATDAILVTRLNGEPLPHARGGPCRLLVPGKSGRYSVKWLDRVELVRRRHDTVRGGEAHD